MSRIEQFVADRINGMTMEAIGQKYGVSKQYVHSELQRFLNTGRKKVYQKITYPKIRAWFVESDQTFSDVERKLGIGKNTLSKKLKGNSWFKKSELDSFLNHIGMTYEEAFKESDAPEEMGA